MNDEPTPPRCKAPTFVHVFTILPKVSISLYRSTSNPIQNTQPYLAQSFCTYATTIEIQQNVLINFSKKYYK